MDVDLLGHGAGQVLAQVGGHEGVAVVTSAQAEGDGKRLVEAADRGRPEAAAAAGQH